MTPLSIDQFAKINIGDAREFKHVERPKDLPLASLQELCELLDVPKGLIVNPANRDEAVAKIQQRVGELLGKVVAAQARVVELIFWSKPVLSDQEQNEWRTRLERSEDLPRVAAALQHGGQAEELPA